MEPLLSIDGLSKEFSDGWGMPQRQVLKELSFSVSPGQILGVVGGNGSGKTTLLKILCGLMTDFEGSVQVLGRSPTQAVLKNQIGYLPERPGYPDHLTARRMLCLCARLSGLSRSLAPDKVEEIIRKCELEADATRRIGHLSKGKRQRLALAQALIHDPKVIVADEPVDGLDPLARKRTEKILRQLADAGKGVVVATHHLDGAESLFDQVLMLHHGRAIYQGEPQFEDGMRAWVLDALREEDADV